MKENTVIKVSATIVYTPDMRMCDVLGVTARELQGVLDRVWDGLRDELVGKEMYQKYLHTPCSKYEYPPVVFTNACTGG